MIGREAFGNPNIFSKLIGKKANYDFFDYLKLAKKYKLYFSQIKFQAIKFTRFHNNASKAREKLIKVKTEKEIIEIMRNLYMFK